MNVGVDVRVLSKARAISRYTKSLLPRLARLDSSLKFYLFTDDESRLVDLNLPESVIVKVGPKLTLKDHFRMSREIKKYPLDLFFHPDNTEFLCCHPRSLVTVHDLIPWLYPDLILSNNPLINLRQRLYLKLQEMALRRSSRRILTVSQSSREDIIKWLNFDPDLITVTYEGVDEIFRPVGGEDLGRVRKKYNLPENYLLYIGGLDERKNLLRLIHAFARVSEAHPLYLVISGALSGSETDGKNSLLALKREIDYLGLSSLVIFTGFVEDGDLPAVYSGARVFVYPSYYEGFGLPPLEAMACGVPVISSNSSSLPEICGEAALLVDPRETQEFFSAITVFLEDRNLARQYAQKGLLQAGRFTWDDCARRTLSVFRSL